MWPLPSRPRIAAKELLQWLDVADKRLAGRYSAANIPKSPGIVNAYAPDSPFSNADGEVGVPNVDLAEEAVNLKIAEITYKANISVIKTAGEMSNELLNIFDKRV